MVAWVKGIKREEGGGEKGKEKRRIKNRRVFHSIYAWVLLAKMGRWPETLIYMHMCNGVRQHMSLRT